MRADRLIAVLLILQNRGRITARELAAELEVSERTARRDLEALAVSGVPVYSKHGRGGGWQLIGGASTDLTGLTSDEARSLFVALAQRSDANRAVPQPLESALRKLMSALPESFREEASAASAAIKVDPTGWGQIGGHPTPPFVASLTDAIVGGRQVRLGYHRPPNVETQRVVHPLGLVTKRNVWYLVANTTKGVRTFRVDRVTSVERLDDVVDRPDDFDLDSEWDRIVSEVETRRVGINVGAKVAPDAIGSLRWQFGRRVVVGAVDGDGWTEVVISDTSAAALAGQLAGYASHIRFIDPPTELTHELARIATELRDLYLGGISVETGSPA